MIINVDDIGINTRTNFHEYCSRDRYGNIISNSYFEIYINDAVDDYCVFTFKDSFYTL